MLAGRSFSISSEMLSRASGDQLDNEESSVYQAAAAIVLSRILGIKTFVETLKTLKPGQCRTSCSWYATYEFKVGMPSLDSSFDFTTKPVGYQSHFLGHWELLAWAMLQVVEEFFNGQTNHELIVDSVIRKYKKNIEEDYCFGYGYEYNYDESVIFYISLSIGMVLKYWDRIDRKAKKLLKSHMLYKLSC